MDIRTREAVRYLGYGRHAVDDRTLAMVVDSFQELEQIAGAKSIYRIFELKTEMPNILKIGNMDVLSSHLFKNMKGCGRVVVFAATLGTAVDRLIKKYTLTDMSKAIVAQACAAALLEEYCDQSQREIEEALNKDGQYLRPRFSPGYGDFKIQHQDQLLRMLEAPKKIGLTMTESSMLTPLKSVTAVMGVSSTKENCHIKGCEVCQKEDCIYRRE